MTLDLVTISTSLLGTIADFCDPWDICSLSSTCRSVNKKLNVSLVHRPFPEWTHETKIVSRVQKILQLPFCFHDGPCFVRLSIKVDRLTRLFICSHTCSDNVVNTTMDDSTCHGTNTELLSMDSHCYFSGYIECRVEPHRTYSIWAENAAPIDRRIGRDMNHYQGPKPMWLCLQTVKMLIWSSSSSRNTMNTKLDQSRFILHRLVIPSPGACPRPRETNDFWLFFTNVFLLALKIPGPSPITKHLESVLQRSIDQDATRALMIVKIFILICHQLMGNRQSDVNGFMQRVSRHEFLVNQDDSSTTFAPLRLCCISRIPLWKLMEEEGCDTDDLVNTTTGSSERIDLDSWLSSWYTESRTKQGLDPSSHSNYVDSRANEFALRYTFHMDRRNTSCNVLLDPIAYGNDFVCSSNIEMDLSIRNVRDEVFDFFYPLMVKHLTATYRECDGSSFVKSMSSLMYVFLEIIGRALVECGSPGGEFLDAFAESKGLCCHQYGVEYLLPVRYKFDIQPDNCSCHVQIVRPTCSSCCCSDWHITLHDDGPDVSNMLSNLISQVLASFMDQHGQANFVSSVSLMMYGFLRTVTQALIACNGPSSHVLRMIFQGEMSCSNGHGRVSNRLDSDNAMEAAEGNDDLHLACFGCHEDPKIPLCHVHIQPNKVVNYGVRDFAVSLSMEARKGDVFCLVALLMDAYIYPPKEHKMICRFLKAVARAMMIYDRPHYRQLATFLEENGFSTSPPGLKFMVEFFQQLEKSRDPLEWTNLLESTHNENDPEPCYPSLLTLTSSLLTVIVSFCFPRDIRSLSSTCTRLHQDLGVTLLSFSSLGWIYDIQIDHDVQSLMRIPNFFPAHQQYLTFSFVNINTNHENAINAVYIIKRPGSTDIAKTMHDEQGNEGTKVNQFPRGLNGIRSGVVMKCLMEPHHDYFLWAKSTPGHTGRIEFHFDIRNIFLCHPKGLSLLQTLSAFEQTRAMVHGYSPIPLQKCDCIFGDYESPLFGMFVNLLACAFKCTGSSHVEHYFQSILEIAMTEDYSRAMTVFTWMCRMLCRLHESTTATDYHHQPMHNKEALVTLPPIRFVREKRNESHLEDGLDKTIPLPPGTKHVQITGRFNVPVTLYVEFNGMDSVHEGNAIVLMPTLETVDSEEQVFLLSSDLDVQSNAISCSFHILPQEPCKFLLKGLEVYLTIENDEGDVPRIVSHLMETFVEPFSEFDDKKLSRLVLGLVGAIAKSLLEGAGPENAILKHALEAEGFATSRCAVEFLLTLISLTSSSNAVTQSHELCCGWPSLTIRSAQAISIMTCYAVSRMRWATMYSATPYHTRTVGMDAHEYSRGPSLAEI